MESKTRQQKHKSGTVQRCRVKNNPTFDPLTQVPPPSFELSDLGMDYYRQFCEILISNSTLTIAYIPIITRSARWFEIYKEADANCRIHGATQVTATGYTQKSGYLSTMSDAEDRMTKIEGMFGMNLHSFTKLDVPKTEKKNPFLEL